MLMKAISLFNRLGKTQDSILTGLLGGLVGTIFMDISNEVIYRAGKTEGRYATMAGQMFVSPTRTKQKKNFILGQILHLATGSIFGLPLMYILKKTGKDHYVAKGLVSSIITWGVLYTGGQKVGLYKKTHLTKSQYSAMFNNLIYGITSAKAMLMMADSSVFEKRERINPTTFDTKGDYQYLIENGLSTDQKQTYLH